jgi:hypothetical protein
MSLYFSRQTNDEMEAPAGLSRLKSSDDLPADAAAVYLAVVYADIFDCALSPSELYSASVSEEMDEAVFEAALRALDNTLLVRARGLICLPGREDLVDLRYRRLPMNHGPWRMAHRYARWLAYVPFVRMVAVSGSLAAANASEDCDVDIFCILARRRLWIARFFIVPMSRLSRFFRHRMCPNYLLAEDALSVASRTLFTAHEVSKAVPLFGGDVHAVFLASNAWVSSFLPQRSVSACAASRHSEGLSLLTRTFERVLGGRTGDVLNATAYRIFFTLYRTRAALRGWEWEDLAPAYAIDRYTVPEGGYGRAVRDRFHQRLSDRVGRQFADMETKRLFGDCPEDSSTFNDWERHFAREYGTGVAGQT